VRILLSCFLCSPGKGSELGNGWYWAKALADCGHDVTVLTLSEFRDDIEAAGRPDIECHYIDLPVSRLPSAAAGLRAFDIYGHWQQEALKCAMNLPGRYDLAHHVVFGSLHLGSMLWRLPIPLLYGPIGGGQTAPASYWRSFGKNWPAETARTAASSRLALTVNARSRNTIRRSAVVLATNSATEAACRRLGASDVRYFLAEGLPTDWPGAPRRRPAGVPVVLWVGRMLPRKAPVLAVQAFAELRRTMPARLVMAGDGPLLGQVEQAVERLDLASDVELLGRVPWERVRELYDCASAFLFTSLRDSSGSQFLEALGRGLPAVALDHHGIGDLKVGTAAIKVPLAARPRDLPGHLATALKAVLGDEEWEARSAEGIAWASEHTWPAKAAAATQIYHDIVSGRD
jgi:glycosyltransferase involved in cell wall biosynthesis